MSRTGGWLQQTAACPAGICMWRAKGDRECVVCVCVCVCVYAIVLCSLCSCAGLLAGTGLYVWWTGGGLILSAHRTEGRALAGAFYQDRQHVVNQTQPTAPPPTATHGVPLSDTVVRRWATH